MRHVGTTVMGNVGCPSPSAWECGVPISPPWGIGWIPTLPHIPTLLQIPTSRLISSTATSFVLALKCMQHVGTIVVGNVGCPSPSAWECGVPASPLWGIGWIPTLPHIPTLLQIPTNRLISSIATSFVMLSNACNMCSPQSWGMWDAPVLLHGSMGYPFPPRGG